MSFITALFTLVQELLKFVIFWQQLNKFGWLKKDIKIHRVLVFSSLENFKCVTVCSWFQGKFLICLQMTAF